MSGGFLMPLAADVKVEGGRLSWQWDLPASPTIAYPRAPVSFHLPDQLQGCPLFEDDCFAVKFTNYWTAALPPGIGLLCTHPANRFDLPFRTVTGLVRADTYENFIHFPALWTRSGLQWSLASRHAGGAVLSRATGASRDGGGDDRGRCGGTVYRGAERGARRSGSISSAPPLVIAVANRREAHGWYSAGAARRRATRR